MVMRNVESFWRRQYNHYRSTVTDIDIDEKVVIE